MKQYIAMYFRFPEDRELDLQETRVRFLERDANGKIIHGLSASRGSGSFHESEDELCGIMEITEENRFEEECECKFAKESLQIKEEDYRLVLAIYNEPLPKSERVDKMIDLYFDLSRRKE